MSLLFVLNTNIGVVTNSVANKKTTHRRNIDGLTDGYARAKIFFSRRNITDGLNPSEFSTVITDG
jgi:hypothetical protein